MYAESAALPLDDRHGAPRLRPRRIQIFRRPAAGAGRATFAAACTAARAGRRKWSASDGRSPRAIPPSTTHSAPAAATPARRGRRRSSCATVRATTIACTRTSTGPSSSRSRSRSCSRSPGETSPAGEFVLTEQRPRMQSRAEVVQSRPGRRRDLRRARAAGRGRARRLPGQHAPRGEPDLERRAFHARDHFSRRGVSGCSRAPLGPIRNNAHAIRRRS